MQLSYLELIKKSEDRAIATDEYMAQIDALKNELFKRDRVQDDYATLVLSQKAAIRDLEGLVALAAAQKTPPEASPRAPDIVILTSGQPGVSGGLASVQEACSWISDRGVNRGSPCIRPAEPNQKHATGRHRYK